MLLIQGLMSGISAGMLIYAATVEMLAGDFVFSDVGGEHGHEHHHLDFTQDRSENHQDDDSEHHSHANGSTIRKRVLAVMSLLTGSIAMALVGMNEPWPLPDFGFYLLAFCHAP
jgi:zinc transporter 1/2/3